MPSQPTRLLPPAYAAHSHLRFSAAADHRTRHRQSRLPAQPSPQTGQGIAPFPIANDSCRASVGPGGYGAAADATRHLWDAPGSEFASWRADVRDWLGAAFCSFWWD